MTKSWLVVLAILQSAALADAGAHSGGDATECATNLGKMMTDDGCPELASMAEGMSMAICSDQCVAFFDTMIASCKGTDMWQGEMTQLEMLPKMCKSGCMQSLTALTTMEAEPGKPCMPDSMMRRRLLDAPASAVRRLMGHNTGGGGEPADPAEELGGLQLMCNAKCLPGVQGMATNCADALPVEMTKPMADLVVMCGDKCSMGVLGSMVNMMDTKDTTCQAGENPTGEQVCKLMETAQCKTPFCEMMNYCVSDTAPKLMTIDPNTDKAEALKEWTKQYTEFETLTEGCPCPPPAPEDTSAAVHMSTTSILNVAAPLVLFFAARH